MDEKPENTEEQPKKAIAKSLITAKRKYFFPTTGKSIEANGLDEAIGEHEKLNDAKAGDE
jgi:hypothetical protein